MKAGTTLGQYRITGSLGLGGMGAVYSAQHTLIGRPAAVKILLPELSNDAVVVQRFFNAARVAAAIRHPGIVEIFDFGWSSDGAAYLVMEQLQGESLADRLAHGRMSLANAALFVRQIAGALAAAHRIGIVHRDLKPDNVFLVPDGELASGERIKLLDFGVAKLIADQDQHRMTRPGMVLGTPTYMSPEQCRGESVDHRADLYSLGCILFELCTGRPPFAGLSIVDVFDAHMHTPPPRLSAAIPGVPPPLDDLVAQLLIKEPTRRLASADAVVRAIDMASGIALGSGPMQVAGPTVRLQPKTSTLSGAIGERPAAPAARGRWLGVAVIAIGAATIGALATGALVRREPPAQLPAVVAPAAPIAPPVVEEVAVAPVVAEPVPVIVVAPVPHPAPVRRVRKPVELAVDVAQAPPLATPPPAVLLPPPPSAPVEATSVTELYVHVGIQLKALEDSYGPVATEDLWTAFRRIHIQDAILDATRRSEAERVLHQLDDIATARAR